MGKTFEQWYTEQTVWGSVQDEVKASFDWDRDSLDEQRIKELLENAWDDSRQNMTTKDI